MKCTKKLLNTSLRQPKRNHFHNSLKPFSSAFFVFFTVLLGLLSTTSHAIDESDLLPVEQAFAPKIIDVTDKELTLRFKIAEGYYLYRHAFKFPNSDSALKFAEAQIPTGKRKVDEFFGEVETYRNQLDIVIPFENPENQTSGSFTYTFQGCADLGVCYPPQKRSIEIHLPVAETTFETPLNELDHGLPGTGIDDLLGNNNWAGQMDSLLTVDQAFKVETIALNDVLLSTRFTIHPNVYLYKDQLEIKSLTQGISVAKITFPKGKIKDDPYFGNVEVFYDLVEIDVAISRNNNEPKNVELKIDYQGCIDEGICYPPASKTLNVELPDLKIHNIKTDNKLDNNLSFTPSNSVKNISEQDQIQSDLKDQSWWLTVLRFLGFGLLLALTPCVFPMIPILSGLIVGQGNITRSKAFSLSLIYVLAMALAYTAAGVIAGMLGANIQAAFQKPMIIIAFSAVFVLLALSMFGFYELQIPTSWQNKLSNLSNKQKGGSYFGVAVMGFLSAIIVGPCVAPPLAGAVLYISDTGDPLVGGLALFAMSIGMGAPLLLIGASAGQWMPQSGGWMNVVKSFFGIALIGMAIWFLSRIIPAPVALGLYGLLALLSAIFWYKYAVNNGLKNNSKGLGLRVLQLLRVVLLVIAALMFYGAVNGHTDPLKPWKKYDYFEFVKIKSVSDLKAKINETDKPILLDFYADWCVECIRMEKTTYNQPEVQKELERFLVLKADVTAQDKQDVELMQAFKIIGPPATLFFGSNDKMLPQVNFFGYMNAEDFVAHLQKVPD